MKGTEKQVSWALGIMSGYEKTLATLKDALSIVRDLSQTEVVDHDPVFGDEIRLVYAQELATDHQAVIARASHWAPKTEKAGSQGWIVSKSIELSAAGEAHPDRKAQAESLSLTIAALETALGTEDDAKYWIERR